MLIYVWGVSTSQCFIEWKESSVCLLSHPVWCVDLGSGIPYPHTTLILRLTIIWPQALLVEYHLLIIPNINPHLVNPTSYKSVFSSHPYLGLIVFILPFTFSPAIHQNQSIINSLSLLWNIIYLYCSLLPLDSLSTHCLDNSFWLVYTHVFLFSFYIVSILRIILDFTYPHYLWWIYMIDTR